ncbi:hypothetical protein [Butyrivibrio sp. INlla21]|uniref:hypothetical protein n=1 Tax=Butyrivibrio sp. INlla21 TaxID=1520811 RepID=UPI0008EC0B4F|nr:hypothetical protein [Butyrivibrio sp. INlla21]SFU32246.1 hypothetical protein SAMN02910342_00068 [Butyrivibrio sp. INlla21]
MVDKEVLKRAFPPIDCDLEVPDSIEFYITDIKKKMTIFQEYEDEFIFEKLVKYCNDELYTPEEEIRIPKQLLIRALTCFKAEHKEEWNVLMGIKEDKE